MRRRSTTDDRARRRGASYTEHFAVQAHQIAAAAEPEIRARQLAGRRKPLNALAQLINDFLADRTLR